MVKPDRIRKSIGAENTFMTDIDDPVELTSKLREIADDVWRRIGKRDFYGRTVTLKVKYEDFEIITRSRTLDSFLHDFELFWEISQELLRIVDVSRKKIRLMGLSISNIYEIEQPKVYQLKFDFDGEYV